MAITRFISAGKLIRNSHVLHIPDGYVRDVDLESFGESYQSDKSTSFSKDVFNLTNSSDYFSVFLTYMNDGCDLEYYYPRVEYLNTIINGLDGYLFNSTNETVFTFTDNGNLIEIHSNSFVETFE